MSLRYLILLFCGLFFSTAYAQEKIHWVKTSDFVQTTNNEFEYDYLYSYSFKNAPQGRMTSNSVGFGLHKSSIYSIGLSYDSPFVQTGVSNNLTFSGPTMFEFDQREAYRIENGGNDFLDSLFSGYDSLGRLNSQCFSSNGGDTVYKMNYNNQDQLENLIWMSGNQDSLWEISYEYDVDTEIKRTIINNNIGYVNVDSMVYSNGVLMEYHKKIKDLNDPVFTDIFKTVLTYDASGLLDYYEIFKFENSVYKRTSHVDFINDGVNITQVKFYPANVSTIDSANMSNYANVIQNNGQIYEYTLYRAGESGMNWQQKEVFEYNSPGYLSKVTSIYDDVLSSTPYYRESVTEFGYTSIASLDEMEIPTLKVYPNPTTDFLNVDGLEGAFSFSIFDMSGKVLLIQKDVTKVDCSSLPAGNYQLIIVNDNQLYSKSIVKEK
jgi:hypothetical protein